MKVVPSADKVDEAMASAQREAKNFFGRDEVYVERYLTWPRHVEVQIVGDTQGDVVWVSTRDCSAQRRHQKLIEEAPAPGLPDGVEDAMGAAAVKAAKAVGYYNAGTVEFIYQDGDFFFLEMNTRLQVEHPVTEVITGIDLVEWQIRVASGEPLPLTQDEVRALQRGHGIEIRINAEDPAGGKFLPSPGKITELEGPRRLRRPLRRRLRRRRRGQPVLRQPRRQADRVGQGPPDGDRPHDPRPRGDARRRRRHDDPGRPGDPAPPRLRRRRALDEVGRGDARPLRGQRRAAPAGPPASRRTDGDEPEPLVRRRTTVEVNGKRFDVSLWVPESAGVAAAPAGAAKARKPRRVAASGGAGAAGSGDVTVPMQGTIVKVLVEVGQEVEVGQGVVVLEAMKMENQIAAEKAGTVKEIKVRRARPSAAATSSPSSSSGDATRPAASELFARRPEVGRLARVPESDRWAAATRRLRRGSR